MRALLIATVSSLALATSAFAADLPNTKGPAPFVPPPPVFTWTGLYIGGQVGYQWGRSSGSDNFGDFVNYNPTGVVGGAHIGYNFQVTQFVFGLEGDVNGAGFHGGTSFGPFAFSTRQNVNGSIRGRVGVAWDRALVYATGGVAFADFHHNFSDIVGDFDSVDTGRVGWTVGGGIEYAIDNNWSVRAEYRYTDYGHFSEFSPNVIVGTLRRRETDNRVQVGFSYKFDMFGPAPVVAKY